MKTSKREIPNSRRAARRIHAAPATRSRRGPADAAAPADGDEAALALPPMFEITPLDVIEALEGVIDDCAGMDDWPDMVEEPADTRRWH